MSEEIDPLEMDVLNCLYFVEPFEVIVEETGLTPAIAGDVLKKLIAKKWVTPMKFDEGEQEYIRSFIYDSDHMSDYRYMATKEGLMKHNGVV